MGKKVSDYPNVRVSRDVAAMSRVLRWQLCQRIGKAIYKSGLSSDQISVLHEHVVDVYLPSVEDVNLETIL